MKRPAPTPFTYYALSVDPQPARADGSVVHVVCPSETSYSIAQIYGVSIDEIVALNQLTNLGRLIFPEQVLVIRDVPTPAASEDVE